MSVAPDIGSVCIEHEEDRSSQPRTHCRRHHPSWSLFSGRLIVLLFFSARACVPCCPLLLGRARGNGQRLVRDSITASPRYCMSRRMAAEACHTWLSLALPKVGMYSTLAEVLCYVLCLLRSAALFRAVPYDAMPMPWPETICRLAYSGSWICELCGCVCVSVCATVRPGIMTRRVEDKEDKGRGPCEEEPTGPQCLECPSTASCLRASPLLCCVMGWAKVEKYMSSTLM